MAKFLSTARVSARPETGSPLLMIIFCISTDEGMNGPVCERDRFWVSRLNLDIRS